MESVDHRRVLSAKPAAGWIGGKHRLADRLVERIAAVPHRTYVEGFVGMGGVFLRRRRAPPVEVINDVSGDVATFYRVLQHHYQAFLDMLRWQISSREQFARLMATNPDTLTDLQRAARFLYLQRLAYGGKVRGRNFGVDASSPGAFDVTRLAARLSDLHDRLAGVVIERLDWSECIERYDTAETLFYFDPPYWGSEDDYGTGLFGRESHAALAATLRQIDGRFILSINDTPETREIFAGFDLEEVSLTYSVNGSSPTDARELIVASAGIQRTQTAPTFL